MAAHGAHGWRGLSIPTRISGLRIQRRFEMLWDVTSTCANWQWEVRSAGLANVTMTSKTEPCLVMAMSFATQVAAAAACALGSVVRVALVFVLGVIIAMIALCMRGMSGMELAAGSTSQAAPFAGATAIVQKLPRASQNHRCIHTNFKGRVTVLIITFILPQLGSWLQTRVVGKNLILQSTSFGSMMLGIDARRRIPLSAL